MSHTVREVPQPRNAGKSSAGYTKKRVYYILGTGITTPEEAVDASGIPKLGAKYPDYNMVVTDIQASEFDDDINKWKVTVTYARPEIKDGSTAAKTNQVSFDTGSLTTHTIQALTATPQNKSFQKGGGDVPLSEGLIGWDGEKAQGVDINDGQFNFTLTRRYTNAEINDSYILALSAFAFRYNRDAWSLWQPGEVLYKGVQARNTSGSRVQIQGDSVGMFSEAEGLTGITSDNTDNGILYLSVVKISNDDDFLDAQYSIKLFKNVDLEKASLVAEAPIAEIGTVVFSPANSSGIGGTIELDSYEYDTNQIILIFPFPWELSYNFSISLNEDDAFKIGEIEITKPDPETPAKLGWEYADVQYAAKNQVVSGNKRQVQVAKYVYLHKVYKDIAFGGVDGLKIDQETIFP